MNKMYYFLNLLCTCLCASKFDAYYPTETYEYFGYLSQTTDEGYLLAGSKKTASAMDMLVLKANKKGEVEWAGVVEGSATDRSFAAFETQDRGVVFGGDLTYKNYESSLVIFKLDSGGDFLWSL